MHFEFTPQTTESRTPVKGGHEKKGKLSKQEKGKKHHCCSKVEGSKTQTIDFHERKQNSGN